MNTFLTQFGEFAVLVVAFSWLAKKIITRWIDSDLAEHKERLRNDAQKDIESHKESLRRVTEREIERLSHKLSTIAKEHEVRFLHLHEKRAQAIEELYIQINELERELSDFEFSLEVFGSVEHLESNSNLSEYLRNNSIFFTSDLCDKISDLINYIRDPMVNYELLYMELTTEEKARKFYESKEEAQRHIWTTKKAVEEEFRALLGVHTDTL